MDEERLTREAILEALQEGRSLQGISAQGVDLSGADLREANLSGADLRAANLSGAYLGGADLSRAWLLKANLSGANLWQANLSGASLWQADLSGANLWAADLSGAWLIDADLRAADLWRADLSGANLNGATLNGATLREADLSRASLRRADLRRADLSAANLSEADLWGAKLGEASLWGADLTKAGLIRANLSKAFLWRANLNGANLNGAVLKDTRVGGVLGLETAKVSKSALDEADWTPQSPILGLPSDKHQTSQQSPGVDAAAALASAVVESLRPSPLVLTTTHPKHLALGFDSSFIVSISRYGLRKHALFSAKQDLKTRGVKGEIPSSTLSFETEGELVVVRLQSQHVDVVPEEGVTVRIPRANSGSESAAISKTEFIGTPRKDAPIGKTISIRVSLSEKETGAELGYSLLGVVVDDYVIAKIPRPIAAKTMTTVTTLAGVLVWTLTFFEQIDTGLGLAAGTASLAVAGFLGISSFVRYRSTQTTTVP